MTKAIQTQLGAGVDTAIRRHGEEPEGTERDDCGKDGDE